MLSIVFPFFEDDGGVITLDSESIAYNCIAWALGRTDQPWWPNAAGDMYWPDDAPREETVGAFLAVFAKLGYSLCETGALEAVYEKLVLYTLEGKPTHAARQLPDGRWTSKLGKGPLASHNTPRGVEGPVYGTVFCYLRRPVSASTS
jgi:hypothetical protein